MVAASLTQSSHVRHSAGAIPQEKMQGKRIKTNINIDLFIENYSSISRFKDSENQTSAYLDTIQPVLFPSEK
jgi:hypothetical protein